jgi:hypothetical protein
MLWPFYQLLSIFIGTLSLLVILRHMFDTMVVLLVRVLSYFFSLGLLKIDLFWSSSYLKKSVDDEGFKLIFFPACFETYSRFILQQTIAK